MYLLGERFFSCLPFANLLCKFFWNLALRFQFFEYDVKLSFFNVVNVLRLFCLFWVFSVLLYRNLIFLLCEFNLLILAYASIFKTAFFFGRLDIVLFQSGALGRKFDIFCNIRRKTLEGVSICKQFVYLLHLLNNLFELFRREIFQLSAQGVKFLAHCCKNTRGCLVEVFKYGDIHITLLEILPCVFVCLFLVLRIKICL